MATLTPQNLPDYIRRFGPLMDKMLATDSGTLLRINALDSTPQSTANLLSQTLKAIVDLSGEFSHDYDVATIARFRSRHTFRVRRNYVEVAQRSTMYLKVLTIQYDHFRGVILDELLETMREPNEQVGNNIIAKISCEYDDATFLALCHLRNVGLLDSPPTLSNANVHTLPDTSAYTNIVVIESTPGNITIL